MRHAEKERGLFSFLTWPFYLAQVLAAQEFLGGNARAWPDGSDVLAADRLAREQEDGSVASASDRMPTLYVPDDEDAAGSQATRNWTPLAAVAASAVADDKDSEPKASEPLDGTLGDFIQGAGMGGAFDGTADARGSGFVMEGGPLHAGFFPETGGTADVVTLLDRLSSTLGSDLESTSSLLGGILKEVNLPSPLGNLDTSLNTIVDGTLDLVGSTADSLLDELNNSRTLEGIGASLDGVTSELGMQLAGVVTALDHVVDGTTDAIATELNGADSALGALLQGAGKLVDNLHDPDHLNSVCACGPSDDGDASATPFASATLLVEDFFATLTSPDTLGVVASAGSIALGASASDASGTDALFHGGKYTDYSLALKSDSEANAHPSDFADARTDGSQLVIPESGEHVDHLHDPTINAMAHDVAGTVAALPSALEDIGLRGGDTLL